MKKAFLLAACAVLTVMPSCARKNASTVSATDKTEQTAVDKKKVNVKTLPLTVTTGILDTIKNNLIGMEVVNGREIRLNIDKNNSNEETASKLQAFMEENKDYNYDAKTEYDDNGFVKSILLTINVER